MQKINEIINIITPFIKAYWIYIVGTLVVISLICFFLGTFFLSEPSDKTETIKDKIASKLGRIAAKNRFNRSAFQTADAFLKKTGASYRTHNKYSPLMYIYGRYILAFMGFFLGTFAFNLWAGLFGAVIGFFLLPGISRLLNSVDNKKMNNDIQNLYVLLSNQAALGIAISSSISKCYVGVRHPRLKTALVDLSSRIYAREDFGEAVNNFNEKFDNDNIQALCLTLSQYEETGKANEALKSLSKHARELRQAGFTRELDNIERNTAIVNLLIFAGIIGLILVAILPMLGDFGI